MYNSDSGEENLDIDALSQEMSGERPVGWVQWFCSLEGHEYLLQIETEFIAEGFNMHGLLKQFNLYAVMSGRGKKMSKDRFRKCISMILSPIAPNEEDL